jgi:hypothetical protein
MVALRLRDVAGKYFGGDGEDLSRSVEFEARRAPYRRVALVRPRL